MAALNHQIAAKAVRTEAKKHEFFSLPSFSELRGNCPNYNAPSVLYCRDMLCCEQFVHLSIMSCSPNLNSGFIWKMMRKLSKSSIQYTFPDFSMKDQVPVGQIGQNQGVAPTVMVVAPQTRNQSRWLQFLVSKKAQIILGSIQFFLGILSIAFNVSI